MSPSEVAAADQLGFPVLSALIVVPLLAMAALALAGQRTLRPVALAGASIELALALVVIGRFRAGAAEFQFAEQLPWIDALGATYHVAVDGVSVLFLPLTALLVLLLVVLSPATVRYQPKPYLMAVLAFEAVAMGVFVAVDLLVFFVFWELLLVPTFVLMKAWGTGPDRAAAGVKYVLYMLTGSAALLVGFILLGINHQRAPGGGGVLSFDLLELMDVAVPTGTQTTVFFLLAFAFAVKAPLLPFHSWMPAALGEGPIGLAVLLAGLKMGVYGFLRFVVPLAPDAFSAWSWLIATLGVVAVLYGALIALVEPNLRRLMAFASVSHVGMAMLGLASLNTQGVQGALFLIVNVGLTSTAMLLVAGFVHHRVGETDVAALGGIAKRAPALGLFCLVASLGVIGLPGTSGFPGEFLILLGAFRRYGWIAAIAVLTVILTAAYVLVFFERAFHGRVTSRVVDAMADLRPREAAAALVTGAAIVVFGFLPGLLLGVSSGSVDVLVERLAEVADTVTAAGR